MSALEIVSFILICFSVFQCIQRKCQAKIKKENLKRYEGRSNEELCLLFMEDIRLRELEDEMTLRKRKRFF